MPKNHEYYYKGDERMRYAETVWGHEGIIVGEGKAVPNDRYNNVGISTLLLVNGIVLDIHPSKVNIY